MTLCLAFTDQDAVYLLADAAVTRLREIKVGTTTFGELEHAEPGRSVEEAALKIMRCGDAAATFSGDAHVAREIFANFVTASRVRSIRDAFASAWISSQGVDQPAKVAALLGFADENGPQLLRFGEGLPADGVPVDAACIGNVDSTTACAFEDAVRELPSYIASGSDRLVASLTFLHQFTIFENLMKHGIGGYFAGCWIGKHGLVWAADVLHVFIRGNIADGAANDTLNHVLTCARSDVFFVGNNHTPDGFNAFGNTLDGNANLTAREYVDKVFSLLADLPSMRSSDFCVDYFVFHNLISERSTVIKEGVEYTFNRDTNSCSYRFSNEVRDIILRKDGALIHLLP